MKKYISQFRGKLFYSLILSYVFLLVLPLLMAIYFYITSIHVIETEIERAGVESLKQYERIMDSVFAQIYNIGIELETNNTVQSIVFAKEINRNIRYDTYELSNSLTNYYVNDYFIKALFVYVKNRDMVITKSGSMEMDLYLEDQLKVHEEQMSQWNFALNKPKNEGFTHLENSLNEKYIIYLRQFENKNEHIIGNVGIVVDTKKILETMNTAKWMEGSVGYILDNNGNVIMATNKTDIVPILPNSTTDYEKQVISNQDILVFSRESTVTGYRYVLAIPEAMFYQKATNLRNGIVIFTLITLLTGILLASFFLKRTYSPVSSIIQMIKESEKVAISNHDEAAYIRNNFERVMQEIEQVNTRVEKQTIQLRNQFFRRLLNGTYQDKEQIEELLQLYMVELEGNQFVNAIVYMEKNDIALHDIQLKDSMNQYNVFLIEQLYRELLGDAYTCYIVEVGKYYVLIINYDEQMPITESELQIKKASVQLKEVLSEEFGIYVSIALSSTNHQIENINHAYNQAMNAMEYTLLFGKENVIEYKHITHKNNQYEKGIYTLESERKLVSLLRNGAFEEGLTVLNNMLDQLLISNYSVEHTRCTVFAMLNTVTNIFKEISVEDNQTWEAQVDLYMKEIISCNSIQYIRSMMKQLLRLAAKHYTYNESSKEKVKEICKFIQNNYHDYNLNVSMIADVFEMNIAKLSAMFKANEGINISNYLSQYRLKKAKVLLKNETLTIKEIANMCGFGDSGTLIRTFKKFEGITPGKARKQLIG